MSATIRDVASLAGVSPMTVSRVVNGSPRVRADTRERVLDAITQLGYVPNSLARGLSRQKTGTIGLIVPDIVDPFFTLILRGSENVARRSGYRIILCDTNGNLEQEADYLDDLISNRVDGLVIAPVSDLSRGNLTRLARHGMPFVLIDRAVPGVESDIVQGDSVGGAMQLVEHLVGLGHRRIAHVTESPKVSTARDRLRGYTDALAAAGIAFDPALVVEGEAANTKGGYGATMNLLQEQPHPTAIFAVNNLTAVGVITAIRDFGLRVPEDIAVVCFDDIELASLLVPFLTVMSQPAETFGTLATQLVLDRINAREPERRRVVILSADLIVRESSGSRT
jgi:LacI family transcriptional regulator, galactose operon repressor